jgi:hypothetical protein
LGDIAADLPRAVGLLAYKGTKPSRILERSGNGFRLAQSLESYAANLAFGADGHHELYDPVFTLHSPGQNDAYRSVVSINPINPKGVLSAIWLATETLLQFGAQPAQNVRLDFITSRPREKPFQIGFGLSPRT